MNVTLRGEGKTIIKNIEVYTPQSIKITGSLWGHKSWFTTSHAKVQIVNPNKKVVYEKVKAGNGSIDINDTINIPDAGPGGIWQAILSTSSSYPGGNITVVYDDTKPAITVLPTITKTVDYKKVGVGLCGVICLILFMRGGKK